MRLSTCTISAERAKQRLPDRKLHINRLVLFVAVMQYLLQLKQVAFVKKSTAHAFQTYMTDKFILAIN